MYSGMFEKKKRYIVHSFISCDRISFLEDVTVFQNNTDNSEAVYEDSPMKSCPIKGFVDLRLNGLGADGDSSHQRPYVR